MTNHLGRKPPAWLARAEAVAAERIAATRWPDGDAALLTRAELERVIHDAVVWAYGRGRADERARDRD